MTIFICIIAYVGAVLLMCSVAGLNNSQAGVDQQGRWPIHWLARSGVLLLVIAGILFSAGSASAGLKPIKQEPIQIAQVIMWPGQDIQFCNGMGAINGGGIVCKHNIYKDRIEMTFMSPGWYKTFWGSGTAASLLSSLCRISNINRVTETVFEPGLVRVRTIPCDTGKSGPWVVVEVPKS